MEGQSKKVFPEGTNPQNAGTATFRSTNAKNPPALHRPTAIRNPYASGRTSIGSYKASTRNAIDSSSKNGSSSTTGTKLASEKAPRMTAVAAPTTLSGSHHKLRQQQSNELEYWERLPSRNVSFSPAEVLTVSECLKGHQSIARLYCEDGRSVRITGSLTSRSIYDDKVELKLGDPLATTTAAVAETIQQKLGAAAALKRKARLSLSGQDKTRRKSKKRPWFVSSSSKSMPGYPKPLQSKHSAPQSTLTVMVDPRCVAGSVLHKAVVGAFVTVIGEFVPANSNDIDEREDTAHYNLEARTLTVSRIGTNMVLYQKALTMRRKSMYERYYYESDIPLSPNKLMQGCGPPPYDAFRHELNERPSV